LKNISNFLFEPNAALGEKKVMVILSQVLVNLEERFHIQLIMLGFLNISINAKQLEKKVAFKDLIYKK